LVVGSFQQIDPISSLLLALLAQLFRSNEQQTLLMLQAGCNTKEATLHTSNQTDDDDSNH